jgi:hypothetical protein
MKKRKTERRGQRLIAALGGRLKSNELLLVLVTWLIHSVRDRPIFQRPISHVRKGVRVVL